jgi:hypothetical protein
MFSKNVGYLDRGLRVAIAIVLLFLGLYTLVGSVWGIVLTGLGLIALVTGLLGTCPLYRLLGISTCKTRRQS